MNSIKLEKNFISVVVYIKNHEKYIQEFIDEITDVLSNNFEKVEMIFVDDRSNDKTVEIIKNKFKNITNISSTLIKLSYEHNIERAMVAGQDIAIGDFIYEFDTPIIDYDLEEVMKVYNQCLKGYDIVSASPNNEKTSSKLFYKIFKRYSKNNINLASERFRIVSRRGINRIKNISQTIPYRKAIYFNCGLKAINLKFEAINKDILKDNALNTNQKVDFAMDNLLFFTNIGWKIGSIMSILMVAFSAFTGIYTLVMWLANESVVSGWTTTMMFLSVAFAGLFILMTIAIKYLSLILLVNTTKQDYVFESVEKIR